uniref:Nif3-like dinuclear metal center hexameric protein n=1 Tax=Risungbinella massiliensis TaxID=1329796 RepID=UPI0005CBC828
MSQVAPPGLAVEKDRIGLQLGDPQALVKKVLVTLDVTEEVVEEAISLGCNWIVAHHAIIFHPLTHIRLDQPQGKLLRKLIQHQIQVFIAHTNLDAAEDGVNDVLADLLGLQNTKVLVPYKEDRYLKLVVFVPESHKENMRKVLGDAGAGYIGKYSHCSFSTLGTGTFMPQMGTNPYIGEVGKWEKVSEVRLETILLESERETIITAMKEAHPYEEVAYDLYPLALSGVPIGFGKVGDLASPISLGEFAQQVKSAYHVKGLRMVGDPTKMVQRVAILGGSGSRHVSDALKAKADVYLTGDIDFHTAQDALAAGISLLDPGHHVEYLAMSELMSQLQKRLPNEVPVYLSSVDTNPFRFV